VNIKLYSAKGCPFARRTRLVLHEKGAEFEAQEVDFRNKSKGFLEASPTGEVPVVVADGDSLYESNIVNQYLDEIFEGSEYLADGFSLTDIAHAGHFVRLQELEENGTVSLLDYPNVASWMERIEARESFKAAR
jgi:glutathione S-transferase